MPAGEACRLIADGALVLDAREPELQATERFPGAVPAAWWWFTEADPPFQGCLLRDDAALGARLRGLGVDDGVPVVSVADARGGWGEDGRMAWTLRALGHGRAVAVDGGLAALRAEGLAEVPPATASAGFTVRRRAELVATRAWLKANLERPGLVVLNVRTAEEFAGGATPHGEARGGHLPGARHLLFKDLLRADGTLRPRDRVEASLGLGDGADEVIAYCTGGTRSAWVTAVLHDLGLRARNFAGSMWEWSAGDPARYPLVTSR